MAFVRYNEEVEVGKQIAAAPGQLAVLIGNHRAMWGAFLEACRCDAHLAESENPLDLFVEQRVRAAASALGCDALPQFA